jgi:hypothetical protein
MRTLNDTLRVAALSLSFAFIAPAMAQSTTEKAKATGNDVKRAVKKGAHRVEEAVCTGTKAECEAQKLKHRATEAKDKVVDEAEELKDKVDSDTK